MSGHIVVVDDDAAFRGELVESLNREGLIAIGHDPLMEPDSAVWAAAETVVLDLCMPGMDGLAWIERLSSLSEPPQLVLMSGKAEDILTASCALAEMRGLSALGALQKPFEVEDLLAVLRGVRKSDKELIETTKNCEFKNSCIYAAIDNNALPLLYQPKVFMSNFLFNGAEVLLSGDVPNFGYVTPSEIVDIASRSPDHLHKLVIHTLKHGINACAEWKAHGLGGPISVNTPSDVLQSDSFIQSLEAIIFGCGLTHSDVIIELTEDGIYNSSANVIETLVRLRIRGIGIALDDIGQRCSSLSQLADLPINEIKIDMRLMRQSRLWYKSKEILDSLVSLASRLHIAVTIEGVESADDIMSIKPYSKAMIQGHYISRKVKIDKLIRIAKALNKVNVKS